MERHLSVPTCFKRILPHSFKKEIKYIMRFAWPLVISNFSDFVIPVVSLLFLGHYDETYLAASGLALSFSNLCGIAMIVGLDTATQTLCSQAYGAKNYRLFGILIQRALILQLLVIVSILPLWINSERILAGLGQDKHVSRLAGQFILWRIPSYVLAGIYKTMQSYLICQEISLPLVVISLIGMIVAVIFNALLVYQAKLGVIGSGLAIDFSNCFLCVLVYAYIYKKKLFRTWPGWSLECLFHWKQFVLLALPGSLMILFDWGTSEVGVFVVGLLGKVELGTQSVIFNIIATLFTLPLSISLVATVKVGHFLGSGEPSKAKNVAKSALILCWFLGLLDATILVSAKDYVGRVFSNTKGVIEMVSKLAPMTAAFHILDGSQGVLAGILRGLGLQKYGAISNFVGFGIVGLPIGIVFATVLKLSVLGFWSGISIGMALQVIMMASFLGYSNWQKLSEKAIFRAAGTKIKPIEYLNGDDDADEIVLEEVEPSQDDANEESSDECPDFVSSTLEMDSSNEIAVKSVHVKLSRYICIRTILVTLLAFSLLFAGILTRCIH